MTLAEFRTYIFLLGFTDQEVPYGPYSIWHRYTDALRGKIFVSRPHITPLKIIVVFESAERTFTSVDDAHTFIKEYRHGLYETGVKASIRQS